MAVLETALGGGLLDFGLNALSGIFGRKSNAKAEARARMWEEDRLHKQFIIHRAASQAAGFNPLTTLGMGTGGGVLANSGATLATQHSVDGMLESVGDVLSGDRARRMAEEKKRAELLDLELQRFKAGSSYMQNPGAAAVRTAAAGERFNTKVRPAANPKIATISPAAAAATGGDTPASEGVTAVTIGGYPLDPYAGNSDAEVGEQRYGEIGSAALGLVNFGADYMNTFHPKAWPFVKSAYNLGTGIINPVKRLGWSPQITLKPQRGGPGSRLWDEYVDPDQPFQMWRN